MKAIMGVLVAGAMVLGLAPAAHATVRYAPTAALTEMGALEQSGLPSVSAPDVSGVSDYGATIASQIEPGGEPTRLLGAISRPRCFGMELHTGLDVDRQSRRCHPRVRDAGTAGA